MFADGLTAAGIGSFLGLFDDNDLSLYHKIILAKKAQLSSPVITEIEMSVLRIFKTMKYTGERSAELNAGFHSLFVYSDIIEHNFVGDSFAQLLRIVEVPNKAHFGEQIVKSYDTPHYIPLQTSSFDTIQLDVKDDTGQNVPFEFGRVIVKLIFKKHV